MTPAPRPAPRLPWSSTPLNAQVKDWATFTRQATEFHLKNARAWANTATGQDLTVQVNPDFIMCPDLANSTTPR